MQPKEKRKRDREFSQLILARDNRTCRWCKRSDGRMNTAHLIPREFLPLRWAECNALCLCFRCHLQWHSNPLSAVRWIRQELGEEKCNELLGQYDSSITERA